MNNEKEKEKEQVTEGETEREKERERGQKGRNLKRVIFLLADRIKTIEYGKYQLRKKENKSKEKMR